MPLILSLLSRYGLQILGCVAVVTALWWAHHVAYRQGYDAAEVKYKEILTLRDVADREAHDKATASAMRTEMLMGQIAMSQAVIDAQKARKREIEYRDVVKTRTVYAKRTDAGKCVIPTEFVRVVDGYGASGVSEATSSPGGVDDGPSGITDVELLSYTTDVKGVCLQLRDALIAWKNRESALQKLESSGMGGIND